MADLETLRRSPLAHLAEPMSKASHPNVVSLREEAFFGMVGVRVELGSPAADRMEAVLGTGLPSTSGETTAAGGHACLWLGPDEWLVVTADDPVGLTARLSAALGSEPGLVNDLSASRTVIELSGPWARSVLDKGCPVDLHPRAFVAGRAVTTTLARVPVLLWQIDDDSYRLLPRASFADYVARWLLDAMDEYTTADTSA
ncbi:sarcosine oxidase subunit gamma [Aeromicrobium sp. P5_D10]